MSLVLCFWIYLGCLVYFETYFILLDLIWLLDLFYDLFYVAHLPYFAISYDVEFDNLIIILFFTNLFATYSFIFFYYKSNIVFFVTIKL